MFHRLARFFVLIAAVQVLGGHWAVLQSVAWARMIVDYAQRESLTVAVAKTFDGAHPCSLCATVSEGRQQEKKQEATTTIAKLDAVLSSAQCVPWPQVQAWMYPALSPMCVASATTPPTPPPLA